jgi:hypothetical protein
MQRIVQFGQGNARLPATPGVDIGVNLPDDVRPRLDEELLAGNEGRLSIDVQGVSPLVTG